MGARSCARRQNQRACLSRYAIFVHVRVAENIHQHDNQLMDKFRDHFFSVADSHAWYNVPGHRKRCPFHTPANPFACDVVEWLLVFLVYCMVRRSIRVV